MHRVPAPSWGEDDNPSADVGLSGVRPGDRTTGKGDRVYICEPLWRYALKRYGLPAGIIAVAVIIATIVIAAACNQW